MEIIDFIYNNLKWHCLKKTQNKEDVEDLLQDMCEVVLRNQSRFNKMNFVEQKMFITKCLNNKLIDSFRKKRLNPDDFKRVQMPEVFGIIELKEVKGLLAKTKHDQLISFAEGYTLKELAKIKKTSVNTLCARNSYAKEFLKKRLPGQFITTRDKGTSYESKQQRA